MVTMCLCIKVIFKFPSSPKQAYTHTHTPFERPTPNAVHNPHTHTYIFRIPFMALQSSLPYASVRPMNAAHVPSFGNTLFTAISTHIWRTHSPPLPKPLYSMLATLPFLLRSTYSIRFIDVSIAIVTM